MVFGNYRLQGPAKSSRDPEMYVERSVNVSLHRLSNDELTLDVGFSHTYILHGISNMFTEVSRCSGKSCSSGVPRPIAACIISNNVFDYNAHGKIILWISLHKWTELA